jgi:hypothetical protein
MLWGLAGYGGMKRAHHVFDGCKVEKWSDNITKWNERRNDKRRVARNQRGM